MGMAPVAHVLFNKFMTFNPKNPDWVNRDRFVLSYVASLLLRFLAASGYSSCGNPKPLNAEWRAIAVQRAA
jgi:transketolase